MVAFVVNRFWRDCVEAVIGAMALDSSFDKAADIVRSWYKTLLAEIKPGDNQKDAKTRLQRVFTR